MARTRNSRQQDNDSQYGRQKKCQNGSAGLFLDLEHDVFLLQRRAPKFVPALGLMVDDLSCPPHGAARSTSLLFTLL
jgi:hypothetical protein